MLSTTHPCLIGLTFPTSIEVESDDVTNFEFPMLTDYDEDETVPHPVVTALQSGAAIEKVETGDEWSDDHCPCLNVVITINGLKYGYSDWWLSREGIKMYHQADGGKPKALKDLAEHILSNAADY